MGRVLGEVDVRIAAVLRWTGAALVASLVVAGPTLAFSFTRNDYPVATPANSEMTYNFAGQTVAVADFDGVNGPDIAATDRVNQKLDVWLNQGDGTFESAIETSDPCATAAGYSIASILAGNLDVDGKPDVALACTLGVVLLAGKGDGTFDTVTPRKVLVYAPVALALARMEAQSALKTIVISHTRGVASGALGTGAVMCAINAASVGSSTAPGTCTDDGLLQDDTGFLRPGNRLAVTTLVPACAGTEHVLSFGQLTYQGPSNVVSTWEADPGTSCTTLNATSRTSVPGSIWGVAGADLNGDGTTDILSGGIAVDGTARLGIHLWQPGAGIAQNAQPSLTPTLAGFEDLRTADFDADGRQDVAVAAADNIPTASGGQALVGIHRGRGDGTLDAPQTFAIGAGSVPNFPNLEVADVDRDGRPDIVTASRFSAGITVLRNTSPAGGSIQGAGTTTTPTPSPPTAPTPPPPPPLIVGAGSSGRGYVTVTVTVGSPGQVSVAVQITPTGRASAAARKRKVTVARATRTVTAAGRVRIRMKLNAAGRAGLKRASRVKARVVVTFRPRSGRTVRGTRPLTLRR